MKLVAGELFGPYELLAPLGEGGMGAVWKSRDTRLNRIVAVKFSHAQFNPRFEVEARAAAALNHPRICALHDIGPDYLVMEYVEGKPIHGPLPIEEVLRLATQIAEALDAAHREHIIHRDLKPGNILVNKSGIKLLDFGLAKMNGEPKGPVDATRTNPVTGEGTILGTPAYMSPEQLEGKQADVRSDVFAFGLVLYEMISGQRAFNGASHASLAAAIMKDEPKPLSNWQPLTPAALDCVVQRCLEKDPDQRWQSAKDIVHALAMVATPATAKASVLRQSRWAVAALCFGVIAAAVLFAWRPNGNRAPAPLIKLSLLPPEGAAFGMAAQVLTGSLSPDGKTLAFIASTKERSSLYVRSLDSLESRALPGTDGAFYPSWSPDSRSIAFAWRGKLARIDLSGGEPQVVCDSYGSFGVAWNRDGVILLPLSARSSINRVPASGGMPTPVTALRSSEGDQGHTFPQFLPDGRHFLYLVSSDQPDKQGIYVASLDDVPGKENRNRLLYTSHRAQFVSAPNSDSGYILFVRGRSLFAQPFDPSTFQLSGSPTVVSDEVGISAYGGYALFSASESGVLVLSKAKPPRAQLMWLDRTGKKLGTVGAPVLGGRFRLSSDGSRVAFLRLDPNLGRNSLWALDLKRETEIRLTFSGRIDSFAWSRNGKSIFTYLDQAVVALPADGSSVPERWPLPGLMAVTDTSPDGRFILLNETTPSDPSSVLAMPLTEGGKPVPYVKTPSREAGGSFSPDGRWVAYESDESGTNQVYVQGFPDHRGKWQISTAGGRAAKWRPDGKEIFFSAPNGAIMAASMQSSTTALTPGKPVLLFDQPATGLSMTLDISPDGRRFLVREPVSDAAGQTESMTVMLNWMPGLKR